MWPYPVSITMISARSSFSVSNCLKLQNVNWQLIRTKTKVPTSIVPEPEIHLIGRSRVLQPGFGKIYDKKPFKLHCTKDKVVNWCACGHSKSQPVCDHLCINQHYKITMRHVPFLPPETKDYWFCNCKQTKRRPFCDGTHRREDVQAAIDKFGRQS